MRRDVLMAHHLAKRLRWCQEHTRWRRAQWIVAFFPDESHYMLFRADKQFSVYRRYTKRPAVNCVLECDHFGGGSILVWAGIHQDGRTAHIYQDEILQHHVVPLVASLSMTMSSHALHASTNISYNKTMFMCYHVQQDRQIYPQ